MAPEENSLGTSYIFVTYAGSVGISYMLGNIYIYTFKKNVLTENTVGTNDFNLIASWGT